MCVTFPAAVELWSSGSSEGSLIDTALHYRRELPLRFAKHQVQYGRTSRNDLYPNVGVLFVSSSEEVCSAIHSRYRARSDYEVTAWVIDGLLGALVRG